MYTFGIYIELATHKYNIENYSGWMGGGGVRLYIHTYIHTYIHIFIETCQWGFSVTIGCKNYK